MPPVGFERTISAGERPLGPAPVYILTIYKGIIIILFLLHYII